jgi:hypothetical protein
MFSSSGNENNTYFEMKGVVDRAYLKALKV